MTPGIERLVKIALGIAALVIGCMPFADKASTVLLMAGTGLLTSELPSANERAANKARNSMAPPAP